jgi:hypothetical protein
MNVTAQSINEDKKKESAGRTASLIWILTGIYYFAATQQAAFLSWQAAVFFLCGTFGAALVFGAVSHYLFAAHRDFVVNRARGKPALEAVGALVNLALNVFEIGAPIFAARWVFLGLHGLN